MFAEIIKSSWLLKKTFRLVLFRSITILCNLLHFTWPGATHAMNSNQKEWYEKLQHIFIIFIIILITGCTEKLKPAEVQINDSDPLIPREMLFSNQDKVNFQLSPDGSQISFCTPVNDVFNLWVGPIKDPDKAQQVTNNTHRNFGRYEWAYTNQHILYLQDEEGNENYQLHSLNLSSGTVKNLTPLHGIRAQILAKSPKHPQEIIIGINDRNPKFYDVYRLNIENGNMTLIMKNDQFQINQINGPRAGIDNDYNICFASRVTSGGEIEIFEKIDNGSWKLFTKTRPEEIFEIFGFDDSGETAYFWDNLNRSTLALIALDLKTKEKTVVAQDPKVDLWDYFIVHPTEKRVQAVSFNYERVNWKVIDSTIKKDLEYLKTVVDGDFYVVSQTLNNDAWIVVYTMDNGPMRYYYYDRKKGTATLLSTANKELERVQLAKMHPVIIKSRDGLDLVSYYTLPVGSDPNGDGIPNAPLPMVLNVHGGPQGRDEWGYRSSHQWLANRGYAVLSINFRGSSYFGKNFSNAGNMEWGRKMQDDLIDGVNWAVQKEIADPHRIAIMGASYGGYATLAALTYTPEIFACGIDDCGISDLRIWIESQPNYNKWVVDRLAVRIGDPRTTEGRRMLFDRSPINHVDNITKPLLIIQGANDPRTTRNQSDLIVSALQKKNISVTYLLYPDEGHGIGRKENLMSYYAVIEAFLANHLDGRYEDIGDELQGSSMLVPVGAEEVPGLKEALMKKGELVSDRDY